MNRRIKIWFVLALSLSLVLILAPGVWADGMYTISCIPDRGWENCYAYWWGSAQALDWPGKPMTAGAYGIYHVEIPADAEGLVFHDGVGEHQSEDMFGPFEDHGLYDCRIGRWQGREEPAPLPQKDRRVTVYFDDGYTWSDCYVHWLGSETLCSWPGELMTRNENKVWSTTVPGDARNLIFSCGDNYSPVLIMPSDENVLYVLHEELWKPYQTTSPAEDLYVVGNTPAFHTDWEELTSANQLHRSGEKWVITYENVPLGYWEFAITDGTNRWGDPNAEDQICRFLAAGEGTMEITFDAQTGKVGWNYSYEPTLSVPQMMLYCRAPEDWDSCYVFWSGSANTCTQKPGEAMAYMGDNLWALEVYSDISNVVFSDGQGERQSARVPYSDRMVYDYVRDCWENPVEIGGLSTLRVVGNAAFMGNWEVTSEAGRMTRIDEYRYEVRFEDVAPDYYEFRIAADANWNRYWTYGNECNYTMDIAETTDLVITADLTSAEEGFIHVTWEENPKSDSRGDGLYRVTGNESFMGNWNPATDEGIMTEVDGGYEKLFKHVQPGQYEFRITYGGTWDRYWGNEDGTNYTLNVETPSHCLITFDPDSEKMTVDVRPTGEVPTYRVVGNASFMGDWNPERDEGLMEQDDNGKYIKRFSSIKPGRYEFRIVQDASWAVSFGDNGDNYRFDLESCSDVVITFDPFSGRATTESYPIENKPVYRVVGNADFLGNWDPAFPDGVMAEVTEGWYCKTFCDVPPGDYEFYITVNGNFDEDMQYVDLQLFEQSDLYVSYDSHTNRLTVKDDQGDCSTEEPLDTDQSLADRIVDVLILILGYLKASNR